jgi:hypothetical protein
MLKENACNYSHIIWKLTSRTMATKVSWIASWVFVRLLPWTQHNRWIPIGSMGCVHTHQGILAIQGWGNQSCIQSVVKKIGEANWKLEKIGQIVSQTPTPGLEDDKIWTWWALDILSKNMLEKVWWCRCFEMEFWNRTICYLMSCSNEAKHAQAGGGRRSHGALKCCWKGKVLLLICVKASRRKGHWSTINLITMIEATRAQLLK